MDRLTIFCPNCQKKYRIKENVENRQWRCKQCGAVFGLDEVLGQAESKVVASGDDEFGPPIAPQPASTKPVVAKLASIADENSVEIRADSDSKPRRPDWLLPTMIAAMFLFVAVIGGVLLWTQSKNQDTLVSRNETKLNDDIQGVERPIPGTSTGETVLKKSRETAKPPAPKQVTNWSRLNYDFPTSKWIQYDYSLNSKFRGRDVHFFGRTFYKRMRKGEVSSESDWIQDDLNFSKHDRLVYRSSYTMFNDAQLDKLDSNLEPVNGHFQLDSNLQPLNQWKVDSVETVPFLAMPISRVGIIPLNNETKKWSDNQTIIITSDPSARQNRIGPDSRRLPGIRFPSRLFKDENNGFSKIPYFRLTPAEIERQSKATKKFNSVELQRHVDYEIKSQDIKTTEILASLKLTTLKSHNGKLRLNADCIGLIRYDNRTKLVVSEEWSGEAVMINGQIKKQLPIKYTCKLNTSKVGGLATNVNSSKPKVRNRFADDGTTPFQSVIEQAKKRQQEFNKLIQQQLDEMDVGIEDEKLDQLKEKVAELVDPDVAETMAPFAESKNPFIETTPNSAKTEKLAPNASRETSSRENSNSKESETSNPIDTPLYGKNLRNVKHLYWESKALGWGVESLDFSDAGILYAGMMDRAISVYDVEKGVQIDEKHGLDDLGRINVSRITPDGKYLLTGGSSGQIAVWQIDNDGKLISRRGFVGHASGIRSMAISPDSQLVLSGDDSGCVRLWELSTFLEKKVLNSFADKVLATAFSSDGNQILATDGSTLLRANAASGSLLDQRKLGTSFSHAADFSPDTRKLAISVGFEVKLFDVDLLAEESAMKLETIQWALEFGPTGKYLYAGCDQVVVRWDCQRSSKVNQYDVSEQSNIETISLSLSGKYLAAVGSSVGQRLRIFELPTD